MTPPTSGRSAVWLAADLYSADLHRQRTANSMVAAGQFVGRDEVYLRLASFDITSAIALAPRPLTSMGCCA